MKQHTSQLRQELLKLGREIDNVITYGNTTLRSELFSVTPLFEGNILKSIMKQLDVETSQNIPEGTQINYQLGIKVSGNYEYLNYGNYIVYKNEVLEDKKRYKLTCYDKMLYAMKQNEALGITYPITIKNYLTALATKIGLTVKSSSFNNESIQIPDERYVGLEYTYRDILDEIAQATGSIIVINEDDQIEVKYPSNTGENLDAQFLRDINVKFGQKYGPINAVVLSRSGGSDNIYLRDEESVTQNGLCELKIEDNQLMNFNDRDQYLQGLLSAVDGLYFYINDFKSTGICYLESADLYNVTIDDQEYQCLMLNDEINVTGGIEELIHTDMPEESITDYSKADKTDRRINQTYLIVDKQNQQINAVISNVGEQDEKIAQLTLTVSELNSKISDATDTTVTKESNTAKVTLEEINASEPVTVQIRPIGSSISYLYPRDNLFPSDTLFMPDRIIRFKNTTTNEIFDWELPTDILYYDENTYDEFYMDYTEQICKVTKKVGYNADGTTYVLSTPTTRTFTYPSITLTEGDYEVSLPGYNSAYLFVRLMSKNIYTAQFVTRVEEQSDIRQTANNINLSVDQKLTNYSTTTEMNAAIDIKANQITSTVSSTYSTKSQTEAAKNEAIRQAGIDVDDKLEDYSTTVEMNSAIRQSANQITSTVSATYATKTQLSQVKTEINQTTDSISLEVSKKMNTTSFTHAQIVAKINDSTSSVLISADKINLTGYLTISSASSTYATKSGLSSGTTTINGGCITTGIIKSSNYEAGTSGTSINLSSGVIDSKNFKVTSTGNITATAGTVGGFTITDSKIYKTKSSLTSDSNGVYIGTDGIALGASSKFKVTNAGALTATNATISGNITATSGTIGGATISNGVLTIKNANIESINGGKITDNSISSAKISSLSANKISGGTISGVDINAGTIRGSDVSGMVVSGDDVYVGNTYHSYHIGDYSGATSPGSMWVITGWSEAGGGKITFAGRNVTFRGGIITYIGDETYATAYIT